ncbi:Ppx/GppA family phosphatase [Endozoicomonas sp. Mp262]|uniref:Ppx/GppA phosphatase family protein n=1 Tax=Endozoicomonas sp. Mp262 TaxID=2919499 RepID=UPI0021D9BFBC
MRDKDHNGEDCPSLVAAIDLGSNSFHMIVARVEQGEIRPLDRLGKKVQLAAGLSQEHSLSDDAIQRGLECLAEFAQYLSGKQIQTVRIVGTNALRKAKNSAIFVEKAQEIFPYPIEVIAGREEARLIYLGVAQTQSDDSERRLVIDIGGGSTEFIIGERFEPKLLESLHMGCVTFTERFFKNGQISSQRYQSAYYAARLELLNIEKQYCNLGWVDTVGSSGSIKAVSNILQQETGSDIITSRALGELKQKMLGYSHIRQLQMPGLRPDRQTIFPGGLAILQASFDALNIKQLRYSEGALREGVLYDLMGRQHHEDVRERTIQALMTRYHVDPKDAKELSTHAKQCFMHVSKAWGLCIEQDLPLLIWAARICKIGLDISHTQFNNHGAYLISHSDLMGFSKFQQQQLALLVEGHRRSIPKSKLITFPPGDAHRLLKLIILLRVAGVITHSCGKHIQLAYQVEAYRQEIKIHFAENWLKEHPLTRAELEREAYYLKKANYTLEAF